MGRRRDGSHRFEEEAHGFSRERNPTVESTVRLRGLVSHLFQPLQPDVRPGDFEPRTSSASPTASASWSLNPASSTPSNPVSPTRSTTVGNGSSTAWRLYS
jgi:hypothetical protein